ncbi:unnamed protein product, partial [Closterium sp. NIES-64]
IVDVVDLLPGPIWHIIFRHLLLGKSHEGRRKRLVRRLNRLKHNVLNRGSSPDALRTFGSCWPLLRCAMVCKRLLHHVASFPEFEPMKLTINSEDPALTRLSGTLSVFLTHAPHTPLNVVLSSPQDLHCLGLAAAFRISGGV